jgi:hypothetical protein
MPEPKAPVELLVAVVDVSPLLGNIVRLSNGRMKNDI